MRETDERQIGAHTYRVRQLPYRTAENILLELLKIVGPSLAAVVGGLDIKSGVKSIADARLSSDALVGALRELAAGINQEAYHRICDQLAEVTQVNVGGDGWPVLKTVQESIFRGHLLDKWKWLAFALEVQYAGFFAELGDVAQQIAASVEAKRKAASSSGSPSTSDGRSGDS